MNKKLILALFFGAIPLSASKTTNTKTAFDHLLPASTEKVPYREIGNWIANGCPKKFARLDLVFIEKRLLRKQVGKWVVDIGSNDLRRIPMFNLDRVETKLVSIFSSDLCVEEEKNRNVISNIPKRQGHNPIQLPWVQKKFHEKVFCKHLRYMHLLELKQKMFFAEKNHKGNYTKLFNPFAKAYYLYKEFGNAPNNIIINILAYSEPLLVTGQYYKKIVRPAFFHDGEIIMDCFVDETQPKRRVPNKEKTDPLILFWRNQLQNNIPVQNIISASQFQHVSTPNINNNNNNNNMVTQAVRPSTWQDKCIVM